MKAEIETAEAAASRILRFNKGTAPSLRVPVTADNRALLRLLRAAELSAWEAADHRSRPGTCGSMQVSPGLRYSA